MQRTESETEGMALPGARFSWPSSGFVQFLGVALVGILLYGHTLHAPWYFDDRIVVLKPDSLGQAWSALFTQRGLARLTFALNYRVGGLNPLGYHLVNIAIHLAAAGLVLLLLRRVFPERRWAPFCGALLFVAHPLQTQAVTYVVQRMASLSALGFLLSLYLVVRGRELLAAGVPFRSFRHLAAYGGALLAGLGALFAKETAIVLPLALLLFIRYFPGSGERRWRPLLLYLAPFCLAPLCFAVRFLVLPLTQGIPLVSMGSATALANLQGSTPLRYLVTEFSVLWVYLRLVFLPWGQALDHGYPLVTELLTVQNVVAALGLAGLLVLAVRLRHRQGAISAAILWFFLTLAVESSFIPLDPLFEHRLYLPMFGLALCFPALVDLIPKPGVRNGVLIVSLLVLAVLTWQRNALWNDPLAFYLDNVRQAPYNERAWHQVANQYLEERRPLEAIPFLERTLQLNPRHLKAYKSLSDIYIKAGRDAEAQAVLEEAIRNLPQEGIYYYRLGLLLARHGEDQGAFALLRRAVAAESYNAGLQVGVGRFLLDHGAAAEAEGYLRRGIELGQNDPGTHQALARAIQEQASPQ